MISARVRQEQPGKMRVGVRTSPGPTDGEPLVGCDHERKAKSGRMAGNRAMVAQAMEKWEEEGRMTVLKGRTSGAASVQEICCLRVGGRRVAPLVLDFPPRGIKRRDKTALGRYRPGAVSENATGRTVVEDEARDSDRGFQARRGRGAGQWLLSDVEAQEKRANSERLSRTVASGDEEEIWRGSSLRTGDLCGQKTTPNNAGRQEKQPAGRPG